jgi:hypothetical protein
MAAQPGYLTVINVDGNVLCGRRNMSMDVEADMAEATTGESTNQWKEWVPMYKGMEFTMEGLVDPAATGTTVPAAIALLSAGTGITAFYGGGTGDTGYTGDGYIRHVSVNGPYDDLKSYSLDIVITGEPTAAVI